MTKITNQKLLEAAAKAAGMEIGQLFEGKWNYFEYSNYYGLCKIDDDLVVFWNPLVNDCDALLLAAKLHLSINQTHCSRKMWVSAGCPDCDCAYAQFICVENKFDESERCAAIRKAIV